MGVSWEFKHTLRPEVHSQEHLACLLVRKAVGSMLESEPSKLATRLYMYIVNVAGKLYHLPKKPSLCRELGC